MENNVFIRQTVNTLHNVTLVLHVNVTFPHAVNIGSCLYIGRIESYTK